jgi:hypothetical protein
LEAATPRYCCATTPSEFCGVLGVSGCAFPLFTSGALVYNPLLTYSLTAKLCNARDVAPSWSRVLATWDCVSARARSRTANSP